MHALYVGQKIQQPHQEPETTSTVMTVSHIPEKGLAGGIILITDSTPSQEELQKACADFHNYPVIRESAIVVLLSQESLSDADRNCLKWLQVPGYTDSNA